jgi:hypothetical protein
MSDVTVVSGSMYERPHRVGVKTAVVVIGGKTFDVISRECPIAGCVCDAEIRSA